MKFDVLQKTLAYSSRHQKHGHVLEREELWGQDVCTFWIPDQNKVVQILASELLEQGAYLSTPSSSQLCYIAAACRIADGLVEDILLAPLASTVIPLPHQLKALERALSVEQLRLLFADEVGLGKTIEAGLVMTELKLRGLVKRILVVAPTGLTEQWVAEMDTHFGLDFKRLTPQDVELLVRLSGEQNPWSQFDRVVCPMDSVKPIEKRKGWSADRVREYNDTRFNGLIEAGWDLIVIDEAHRLGGSTEQVARYKLGLGLANAAPYLLLLSATPHQGKSDAFRRLMALLDPDAFPDESSIKQSRVKPYVVRTEKRRAIDMEGKPLFTPRRTELIRVSWTDKHAQQRLLYEAVTTYVRDGYNQAVRAKQYHIGFLMVLMQRLVSSSTRAIRSALERRLEALEAPEPQPELFDFEAEQWEDLDGQAQFDLFMKQHRKAVRNEQKEVKALLSLARECEGTGNDAKADGLLDLIYQLQREENDSDLKVLIFTEFVATQEMLAGFLGDRGISVTTLNGSMNVEERRLAQEAFAKKVRVLISTDAGGEGLNLQFCHVVVNYDLPWNPMRLEQRIGRVDRIGQRKLVRAANFVIEDTVEYRVREVLEEKLAIIFAEFGVDKAGDVLDSAEAGSLYEKVYIDSLMDPDRLDEHVDSVVMTVREEALSQYRAKSVFGEAEALSADDAQRVLRHPLPHWVETMVTNYLEGHEGKAIKQDGLWRIQWPDGETLEHVTFDPAQAQLDPLAHHLTLEDARVRGLCSSLPRFTPGQPIASVHLPGLPTTLKGHFGLWRIGLSAPGWNRQRVMPLYVQHDGRSFAASASRIWDALVGGQFSLDEEAVEESTDIAARLETVAEKEGHRIYQSLLNAHQTFLKEERSKGDYAFDAKRRAIEQVGLPEVKQHRLRALEEQKRAWQEELREKSAVLPDLHPVIILSVKGG